MARVARDRFVAGRFVRWIGAPAMEAGYRKGDSIDAVISVGLPSDHSQGWTKWPKSRSRNLTPTRPRSAMRTSRAMRVYTPEEAMDLLSCNAPHWDASTLVWQGFLHRAAPLTRATQRGIAEAA